MSSHANISIFVPHLGCKNLCSFCNQFSITGHIKPPTADDVKKAVEIAMNSKNYNAKTTEIAFFGGSFTAIDRDYMVGLLATASRFVELGVVSGIRVSTRPDCIDRDVLTLLKHYKVTAIELGAQSTDDNVLNLNRRGHSKQDIFNASLLIKEFSFSLGLQMMTGLYGSNNEIDYLTARDFILLKPDTVRIYPTVVLKHTALERLYIDGKYKPQKLNDAVILCESLYRLFTDNSINVIRLGLHSIDESEYVAGPWHPAFSQLCYSLFLFNLALSRLKSPGNYVLKVNPCDISNMIGQHKENIFKLKECGFNCKVLGENCVPKGSIIIKKEV